MAFKLLTCMLACLLVASATNAATYTVAEDSLTFYDVPIIKSWPSNGRHVEQSATNGLTGIGMQVLATTTPVKPTMPTTLAKRTLAADPQLPTGNDGIDLDNSPDLKVAINPQSQGTNKRDGEDGEIENIDLASLIEDSKVPLTLMADNLNCEDGGQKSNRDLGRKMVDYFCSTSDGTIISGGTAKWIFREDPLGRPEGEWGYKIEVRITAKSGFKVTIREGSCGEYLGWIVRQCNSSKDYWQGGKVNREDSAWEIDPMEG